MKRNVGKEKKSVFGGGNGCRCHVFAFLNMGWGYILFSTQKRILEKYFTMPSRAFRSMIVGVLHIDKSLKCLIMSCLKS